jgi:pectate lyase
LNIPYSYITIDGASAPSPGITIVQPGSIGTTIEASSSIGAAHDIIIHHLRMDGEATGHTNSGDIWGLDGQSAPVYNITIDHVTAIASTDGVFDIWEEVHDVTFSWNMILDTVTACHLSTGDESQIRRRISFHHNVFARNNERQIRLRHNNQLIDYVNNVIYGWGWFESGAAGLHIAYDSGEVNPSINVVNNVFHHVSGLGSSEDSAVIFERGASEGDVYFSGNLLPAGEDDAVSTSGQLPIPESAQVTLYSADTLQDTVVPHVGTHYPTSDEQQLINQIRSDL